MSRQRLGLFAVAVLFACSGTTTSYVYPADLTHPNYVKRSKAVQEFATRADEEQLPGAFRLLMDDHAHIRAIAAEALRSMTPGGRDFGYKAYLPARDRAGIAERWRAYWVSQAPDGAGGAEDGP